MVRMFSYFIRIPSVVYGPGPLACSGIWTIFITQCGSHVMSAYELAHRSCRPLGAALIAHTLDFFGTHATLYAKRKLSKILFSKPIRGIPLSVGDLTDVYVKYYSQKREQCRHRGPVSRSSARDGLSLYPSHGRTMNVAVMVVRL